MEPRPDDTLPKLFGVLANGLWRDRSTKTVGVEIEEDAVQGRDRCLGQRDVVNRAALPIVDQLEPFIDRVVCCEAVVPIGGFRALLGRAAGAAIATRR